MEPLLRILRDLRTRFTALSAPLRWLVAGGALLVITGLLLAAVMGAGSSAQQYVFTNLTPEDSSEAQAALKVAGIPAQAEAGGSALKVPASRVHDARLLLASQGLPRGGGVGFELFDRGDFGTSEFTQRVNLRRATEGELARTIGRLSSVRSARVHLTLPEKGLYREDDRKASAAVVLNLQPGRSMQERELAGIRHLVASAIPSLDPEKVTVVDQRGTVLAGDTSESARLATQQREIEGLLEQRITDLLEPVVGQGKVVAKVTAALDTTEVETTADAFDGENTALRSERRTIETLASNSSTPAPGGVAGAAANQPGAAAPAAPASGAGTSSSTNREDEVKNYEVSKKITRTIARLPRINKLSAAVLVDGLQGKPRAADEMKRLAELAKKAMGFDVQRGDQFELSSEPFLASTEALGPELPFWKRPETLKLGLPAAVVLVALIIGGVMMMRRRRGSPGLALLKPGASVAELEAAMAGQIPALPDPVLRMRDRARELAKADPQRTAHLLRAWVAADIEAREGVSRAA